MNERRRRKVIRPEAPEEVPRPDDKICIFQHCKNTHVHQKSQYNNYPVPSFTPGTFEEYCGSICCEGADEHVNKGHGRHICTVKNKAQYQQDYPLIPTLDIPVYYRPQHHECRENQAGHIHKSTIVLSDHLFYSKCV